MRKGIFFLMLCFLCGTAFGQSVESMTPQTSYQALLQEEQSVMNEIESISSSLSSLRGGKAKKATKRLNQLVAQKDVIERTKVFYPESVKNNSEQPKIDEKAREQVRQMIDERIRARGGNPDDMQTAASQRVSEEYWSVVISISTNPDPSKYRSYGDVEVENMAGRYFFFLGRYSTKSEADNKCKQLVSKGRCRDAFVVKRNK